MTAENLITLKISNGALKGDKLPTRLKVFGWGANDSTRGTFTAGSKTAQVLSANQHALGYERVAIDFDHCTVSGTSTHTELMKAGQPPLIFGYGTVKPVAGDGIYLEDITWTPLGMQHARNFEDLSPAIKDDAGEVVLVHSVALTPNGSVHGLQFFSATPNNNTPMFELAEMAAILGLSATATKPEVQAALAKRLAPPAAPTPAATTTLSAADLSAAITAAITPLTAKITTLESKLTEAEKSTIDGKRAELVALFARDGKTPKKADGTAYSAEELKALSLDTLQLLHANSPVTVPLSARGAARPEAGGKKYRDEKTGIVDLASIFEDENKRSGLSLVPPANLN